jgi:hypothetical protein
MMVALAKDGKPRRPPLVLSQSKPPPLVTFKREKKRAVEPEEEDGLQFSLFSSMARTPKKQRTVEQTTLPGAVPNTVHLQWCSFQHRHTLHHNKLNMIICSSIHPDVCGARHWSWCRPTPAAPAQPAHLHPGH